MKYLQGRVFQAALELAVRAGAPAAAAIDTMVERVQVSRRQREGDDFTAWAADFLSCLPEDAESKRLLVLAYVPGYQCGCPGVLHYNQQRCDECGCWPEPYRWTGTERQRAGGAARKFWATVQARRLFAPGLKIAERGL